MCSSPKDSTPIPSALQPWGRSFWNMNHQVDKPHLKHSSLGVYALFVHTAATSFLGSESVRSTKLNEAAYLSHGKDGSIYSVFKVLYKMYKSEQHPSNQSPSELLYHPEHKVHIPRSNSFRVRRLQQQSQVSQVTGIRLLFYCCNNYCNQGNW